MLIESSKDLLYVVIAFCVLWITIFTAWFIYYLAMIMRQILKMIKDTRAKFKKVDDAIENFKQKLDLGAAGVQIVGEGFKKVMEMVKEKKGPTSAKATADKGRRAKRKK